MSHPVRRIAALFALLALLIPIAACGSDDSEGDGGSGEVDLSSVEVNGAHGKAIDASIKEELKPSETESDTLIEGDGEELKSGDTALAQVWIGNGSNKKKLISTYEAGGAAQPLTLNDQVPPMFKDALEGHKVGDRVMVVAPPKDAYGDQGNPQLGLGNKDSVVLVVDIVGTVLDGPEGKEQPAPKGLPKIVGGDTPTGFDFKGATKPSSKLQTDVLVEGEGAEVKEGDTLTVNYLGQTFGGKKPFDDSYSRGQPASFPLTRDPQTGVIPGWVDGLAGQKVGSRVVLQIPPELGYGEKGNPQAGIKGTDTLVFVVDILSAS